MYLFEASLDRIKQIEAILADLGQGESGFGGTNYGEDGFNSVEYINYLHDNSLVKGLKPGYVPQTTFFMQNHTNEIVGIIRLRHNLTPELLIKGGHIGYFIKKDELLLSFGED